MNRQRTALISVQTSRICPPDAAVLSTAVQSHSCTSNRGSCCKTESPKLVNAYVAYLALVLVLNEVGSFIAKLLDFYLHDAPKLVVDVVVRASIGQVHDRSH